MTMAHLSMDSFQSKLDRNIARSFLSAPPTTAISYRPVQMANEANQWLMRTTPMINTNENLAENWISQPHRNAQLDYPINSNIHPMYYDVIIDTVTDYDSESIEFHRSVLFVLILSSFLSNC